MSTDPTQTQPEPNPRTPDRLAELTALANGILTEIGRLTDDSGRQLTTLTTRSRTDRRMILMLVAGGVLDVILTVVLGIVGAGVISNNERLDQFSRNLAAQQTDQRRRALCPLYGILSDARSAEGRAEAQDKGKYDHSFEVIEEGYLALGCDKFLAESGRDKW